MHINPVIKSTVETFKKNLLEISHIYRRKSCNFANYILRTKQLITNSTIK